MTRATNTEFTRYKRIDDSSILNGVSGRALMAEVRRARDAGDAAALGRAAHTLKGMISNFCSPTAQASAFAVEQIGTEGDLSSAPEAVTALESHLDVLSAALNDFVATRSS